MAGSGPAMTEGNASRRIQRRNLPEHAGEKSSIFLGRGPCGRDERSMTDEPAKPGLLGRLFGRAKAEATAAAPPPAPVKPAPKESWWNRLRDGLSRSSATIGQGIADIFTKRKL